MKVAMQELLDSRTTLRDSLVDRLRESILTGELQPGEKVNQVQIARAFGVSRGPLREALSTLQEEGLIENIPYRGTFVVELTNENIREIFSVRGVLESFAIRLVIQQGSPHNLERLRSVTRQMQQAAQAWDVKRTDELDMEFHQVIIESAQHNLLLQMWQSLASSVRLCLAQGHRAYEAADDIMGTHPAIFEAIEAKDTALATRLLEEHIQSAETAIASAHEKNNNRH